MMTAKRAAAFAAGAAAALALCAGCAPLKEQHTSFMNRTESITNVVGSIWRIQASWPNTKSSKDLSEHLYERAQRFCGGDDQGMMPLTGTTHDGSGDAKRPATGWLEFRCANPEKVEREYKGITLHFDDLLDDEESKK